jgi:hypothetical protein
MKFYRLILHGTRIVEMVSNFKKYLYGQLQQPGNFRPFLDFLIFQKNANKIFKKITEKLKIENNGRNMA